MSNCGRVKSVEHVIIRRNGSPRPIREKLIHSSMLPNGYLHVTLYKDCKQKHFHVHRLVAKAFIPNPNNLPEINHKDEYKTNNHVDNLEWCDRKYNVNYGTTKERMILTQIKNGYGGKTVLQFSLDGMFLNEYPSVAVASRALNIRAAGISSCCHNRKNYTQSGGFQWKFKNSRKEIKNILPIIQTDLEGNEKGRFKTVKEASKVLNIPVDGILDCISGLRESYRGYKWTRIGKLYVFKKKVTS